MTVDLVPTRLAWHGVAEFVLAGPQYAAGRRIDLRVTPGGFATVAVPDLRVDGVELVAGELRIPLDGRTIAEVAALAGVTARALDDVYAGGPGIAAGHTLSVDPAAATILAGALASGDAALRAFAPEATPVLWPEHFDVAITVDKVNYGVSPGDDHLAEPYAYVGPWEKPSGPFWNAPFGAARPIRDLPDTAAVLAFFAEGRTALHP